MTPDRFFPPGSGPPEGGGAAGGAITAATVADVARALRQAGPRLRALGHDDILAAVDRTVADWLRTDCAARKAAEEAFSAATGIPAATTPFLPQLRACAGERLREWARGAAENGPALVVHVLPGNVPMVWLPALLACVFMRVPCLLKPSADDPETPARFVAALAGNLPVLASGLAVLPWPGGDEEMERAAFRAAGAVIAFGGDSTVRSLATRVPAGVRLIAHGPRIAAGIIARESADPDAVKGIAPGVARDVLLHDGRGCLSLSVLLVEGGGRFGVAETAKMLADSLARTAAELPSGRPGVEIAVLTQSWRGRMLARELAGRRGGVLGSEVDLSWTIFHDEDLAPPGVPLARSLWVAGISDLHDAPARLAGLKVRAHALALAGGRGRLKGLAGKLANAGITLTTEFGKLQEPPLTWAPGGISWFRQLAGPSAADGGTVLE